MNNLVPMRNCPGVQGELIRMPRYYGYRRNCGPNTLGYVAFTQNKSTFARPKKMQTLVFILPKVCTKNYTKEISAKQVATQSDFLMALHLEL